MIKEYLYYYISKQINIEPFDAMHKLDALYLHKQNLLLLFEIPKEDWDINDVNVFLFIKEGEERPKAKYVNVIYSEEYLVETINYILKKIGLSVIQSVESVETVNSVYRVAVDGFSKKYRDAVVEYMMECDEHFYPPPIYHELYLENWFRMQPDGYEMTYKYNGNECKIVNSTFAWGDWGVYYSAIRKYMAVTNSGTIPTTAEFARLKIGGWVGDQRTAYKQGYMSLERLALLREANISMNIYDDAWNEKYELLKKYKEEYGSTNIEKRQKYKGVMLGLWCQNQRDNYKTGRRSISEEQIQRLSDIGFDWDPLETEWNRRYEQYKRYIKENNGDTYIPRRRDFEGEHLGAWVETQRKWFAQGKMNANRYNKLKAIGMIFKE